MAQKVRIGIVGLGTQGPVHAESSYNLGEAELVAVCDVVESRAKKFATKYHCDWYTNYREMLERKDIEAIIIATPDYLHAPMAIEAAKAGKHVAVEKPMCISLEQADEMIKAVKKAGVLDCYFENLCYAPALVTAKAIIDDGGIGEVFFMRCGESVGSGIDKLRENYKMERAEKKKKLSQPRYGVLLSMGCHPITYCRYIFNKQPVTKVYAETRSYIREDPKCEDVALLTITFRDGQVAWVDSCIYALGTIDDRAEIYGTKGTIFVDLYGPQMTNGIKVYSQSGFNPAIGSSRYARFGVQTNWIHPIPDEMHSLGYYHEQQAFLRSILADNRPNINFDDGKATLEVIFAAYKSRDTGKAISLPIIE